MSNLALSQQRTNALNKKTNTRVWALVFSLAHEGNVSFPNTGGTAVSSYALSAVPHTLSLGV